jgi:trehalose 6-phosphate synthase
VDYQGQTSLVRPFPISVQSWSDRGGPTGEALEREVEALRHKHRLTGQYVAVGVDRIDYTKGLPERLRAIDRFLEKHPEWQGRFTFVELGAPSRTHLRRYRELVAEIEALADEINWKHQLDGWKPVHLLVSHHDSRAVHTFMRMASMCIVSSLHDGMNLVAKEYVAAVDDGVLVLSEFAGAAHELGDALIVNPYDTEAFAEAIRAGVEMDRVERGARLARMKSSVAEHNVYRWAAELITALGGTSGARFHENPRPAAEEETVTPA